MGGRGNNGCGARSSKHLKAPRHLSRPPAGRTPGGGDRGGPERARWTSNDTNSLMEVNEMSRTIDTAGERVFVVSPRRTPQGICGTCAHAAYCMFAKDRTQPVWHCEEFEPPRAAADNGWRAAQAPAEEDAAPEVADFGGPGGLCAFCTDRGCCVCAAPGTTVQHCEEYR